MPSGHHGLLLLNCNYNFFSHVVHFTFCLSRLSKNEYQKWVSSCKFLLSTQYFTNVYTFDSRNEKLSSKVNYVPLHYLHDDSSSMFAHFLVKMLRWTLSYFKFYLMYFSSFIFSHTYIIVLLKLGEMYFNFSDQIISINSLWLFLKQPTYKCINVLMTCIT